MSGESPFRAPPLRMVAVRRERTELRVPAWYRRKCEAVSRAVWVGQLTDREPGPLIDFWHRVFFRLEPPA